jgi:hypothetical protein
MNTMKMMGGIEMNKMPGFTAETALHTTSGHYRTSRNGTNNLATRMEGAIQLAEVINVHGCAPGSTLFGYDDGSWECFPNPLTEGGGGSSTGGIAGGGSSTGGGGTRGARRPKKTVRPPRRGDIDDEDAMKGCTMRQLQLPKAGTCLDKNVNDLISNPGFEHFVRCDGPSSNKMRCCENEIATGFEVCEKL